jgi:hypothetical protein
MADTEPILVTGAASQLGAVGRTVTGLLLGRGLPVRDLVTQGGIRMSATDGKATHAAEDGDIRLEDFVAELTGTVYRLLLRCGFNGSWVRVELALWRGLADVTDQWARERPSPLCAGQSRAWRAGFVAGLTARALSVARQGGMDGPGPGLGSALSRACRHVLRQHSRVRPPW